LFQINRCCHKPLSILTDRFDPDDQQVGVLLKQIVDPIDHFTADGAYDKSPAYHAIIHHSPEADVVIPPREDAVLNAKAATLRNRNIQEIKKSRKMDEWLGRKTENMNVEIYLN
jgi:hypothetical protein